jgi:ubiquitin-protein ligase
MAPQGSRQPATESKLPMRTRRLLADAEQMHRAFDACELIRFTTGAGDPPERYLIEYHVAGLQPGPGSDQPQRCERHTAEIQLTRDYPRLAPKCRMVTPIFHPNMDAGTICVGDHWTAGERLVDLVIRIGEMIAYQAYNIRSPLDGEAAMWADLNRDQLPVDARNLRPAHLE